MANRGPIGVQSWFLSAAPAASPKIPNPWGPMGSHGVPWGPMGPHGSPLVPIGSMDYPWIFMGPHGSPWVPWSAMGSPWGPHGAPMGPPWPPWKIQECRKSWNLIKTTNSIRNMFPLHPVTSKRPESPYGANKKNWQKINFFSFSPY